MHRTTDELRAGLDTVRSAPRDGGTVELIVCRPAAGERLELDEGQLDRDQGLVGDNWRERGSRHTLDGSAEAARQITVMNARATALIAGDRDRWALAGDQLYIDLDISETNLPAGTRLAMGTAVLEISDEPHTGCAKFAERFGMEAARFVNHADVSDLRLRGLNAVVVGPGMVRRGDTVKKLP